VHPRDVARKINCAEATVYRWVRSGDLPSTRPLGAGPGRPIVIDPADVDAFLAKRGATV
jgi:excisionase family DNA binding protein